MADKNIQLKENVASSGSTPANLYPVTKAANVLVPYNNSTVPLASFGAQEDPAAGLVPSITGGYDEKKVLKGNGTWSQVSYNDLTNKPTIPSAVTESTVSGWGFTKNTGTYSKPSGGIPNTDVAFNYAGSGSKGGSATSAVKLDSSNVGSTTKPVYFGNDGKPSACSYDLPNLTYTVVT